MTTETKAQEAIEETVTEAIEEVAEEIAEEIAEEVGGETETTSSDAVTIAAIEADKEVRIAEIQAEVSEAAIEAEKERERSWQEEVATLQANMLELKQTVETLAELVAARPLEEANLSTPQTLTEAAVKIAEEVEANNSIPQSTLLPISETETEVIVENEEGEQAEVTVETRARRRLI